MAEKYDCIKFCFKLRSSASEVHEIFKTVPWREHRTRNGFLESNTGKLWSKIVSVQVIPPHVCTQENMEKIYIIINQYQQSTILETAGKSGHLYGNSKGRLEHVVDLC
jgi:hypothetical protein